MHDIKPLPAKVLALLRAKRGLAHPFENKNLDMRRTAHIIVDLQNGFMAQGAPLEVVTAREMVPNVNAISAAVRKGGGKNYFTRMTVAPETLSSWSTWFTHLHDEKTASALEHNFAPNAHNWQLWPELDVGDSDKVIDKTRFSAFVSGSSRLHELLQRDGIDTLIITGALTNCCCDLTAKDAMQINYKVIFVSDGNAALTDDDHNTTLASMILFADVMSTKEVLSAIGRSTATAQ